MAVYMVWVDSLPDKEYRVAYDLFWVQGDRRRAQCFLTLPPTDKIQAGAYVVCACDEEAQIRAWGHLPPRS